MPNDFLAKSNGISLTQHTSDVMQAITVLKEKYGEYIPEEWWIGLLYSALLHDLGKIDPVFQGKLTNSKPPINKKDIPHGLLSLFFIKPELFSFSDPHIAHTIISAVAFHHWRDSFPDLLMGLSQARINEKAEEFVKDREQWIEKCNAVKNHLSELINKYNLNSDVIEINNTLVEYLCYNNLGSAGLLVPPYTLVFLPSKIKNSITNKDDKFRIFLAGNLMRADHFASMVETCSTGLKIDDIEFGGALNFEQINDCLISKFGSSTYWQKDFFVDKPQLQGQNLVLVAPTGFGKTEFAYLWGAGKKNFITLPIQAAVNKIHERTQELFDDTQQENNGNVALLHGNATLEIFRRSKQKNDLDNEGEMRKAVDLARHLSKPYIIATVDQFAPAALRYPGYERIFAALMDGYLVIDEVQAYDPKAAAIVTHLVQQNAYFGGKTLLMTATLPPFIRKEMELRIGLEKQQITRMIEEPGFEDIATSIRHRINFMIHEGDYNSIIQNVLAAIIDGKKVLIVMNTVTAASALFERVQIELESLKIKVDTVLLHSRFTIEKRKELEEMVVDEYMPNTPERKNKACIVIATQIVEASLDIDADLLFTEPAPVDSLIQRMGRVFRRFARSGGNNASENANVIIMVNNGKKENSKDTLLASGMRTVYDRDLTAISIIVLLLWLKNKQELFTVKEFAELLTDSPWKKCFAHNETSNKELCQLIISMSEDTICLTEKQKMKWVELSYGALEEGRNPEYALKLGTYLNKYYEILDILDHGYCSDRRRDAMRLFRDVNDVTVIPADMIQDFYVAIRKWVEKSIDSGLNYLELSTAILPKYTANCPYNATNKGEKLSSLNIDAISPTGLTANQSFNIREKLEKWLSDIKIINMQYDQNKGLIYYEK